MEHRAVNDDRLMIRRNMLDMYRRIGQFGTRSQFVRRHWGEMCRNASSRSIGNYAIVESWNTDTLGEICEFAGSATQFYVFSFTDISDTVEAESFERAGFSHIGQMVSMMARGNVDPVGKAQFVELLEVRTADEKLDVAKFIARQFFDRRNPSVLDQIAQSTAGSGATVWKIVCDGERVGALMTNQVESSVGIYNFCIAATHRCKGIGSESLRCLERMFATYDFKLGAQCDPKLRAWYERLGFGVIEPIDVWRLEFS